MPWTAYGCIIYYLLDDKWFDDNETISWAWMREAIFYKCFSTCDGYGKICLHALMEHHMKWLNYCMLVGVPWLSYVGLYVAWLCVTYIAL